MKSGRIIISVLVVALVVEAVILLSDPLNRLVARLEWMQLTHHTWSDGFWTPIDLPSVANTQSIVDRFASGELYKVVEEKQISFPEGKTRTKYKVVLVDTNHGRIICLFRYVSWTDSWQARTYSL